MILVDGDDRDAVQISHLVAAISDLCREICLARIDLPLDVGSEVLRWAQLVLS